MQTPKSIWYKFSPVFTTFAVILSISIAFVPLVNANVTSIEDCIDANANSIPPESGGNSANYNIPASQTINNVCIRYGTNSHTGKLTNGSYVGDCYTISGVGTNSISVTRNDPACGVILHIDAYFTSNTSPTPTPSISPSITPTPSITPNPSGEPSPSPSISPSPSEEPTPSPSITPNPSEEPSPSPSISPSPSEEPTPARRGSGSQSGNNRTTSTTTPREETSTPDSTEEDDDNGDVLGESTTTTTTTPSTTPTQRVLVRTGLPVEIIGVIGLLNLQLGVLLNEKARNFVFSLLSKIV